jgi:hypothetical protein
MVSEANDVVIRRVQNQQVRVREAPLVHHFLNDARSFGLRAVAYNWHGLCAIFVGFHPHTPQSLLDTVRLQVYTDCVASKPDCLDERCAKAHERVYHQLARLGEAAHSLLRDLRHEVPPILCRVRPTVIALTQQPQTIRDEVVVLCPTLHIDFAQWLWFPHGSLLQPIDYYTRKLHRLILK